MEKVVLNTILAGSVGGRSPCGVNCHGSFPLIDVKLMRIWDRDFRELNQKYKLYFHAHPSSTLGIFHLK